MLFNEPKLLKLLLPDEFIKHAARFSALQRAEIAEMARRAAECDLGRKVSVLFNEPKLLKFFAFRARPARRNVSVLFNEPKLLKCRRNDVPLDRCLRFSALQRAEIAEILVIVDEIEQVLSFSALQRAEIAEMRESVVGCVQRGRFQCSSTSRNC